MDHLHPGPGNERKFASHCVPYSGGSERRSGRPIQEKPDRNRMGVRPKVLLVDNPEVGSSTGRPLRHTRQQESSGLHLSSPGPSGGWSRRLHGRLEPLGHRLLVPTYGHAFKSAASLGVLSRDSAHCNTVLALESVVHSSGLQSQGKAPVPRSSVVSDHWRQEIFQSIRSLEPPSLLEVMTCYYSRKFSKESASILVQAIRASTTRQYQSIWASFCSFLRTSQASGITVETVLAYLRFLFNQKKLAPATLSAYRSALAKPLLFIFDIDVSKQPFVDAIRAFFNIRPNRPVSRIAWSLDNVLNYILSNSLPRSSVLRESLMSTAFLLALATGRRVSELNALLRTDKFLQFDKEKVTLFPNPNFLAKNEDPSHRWDPIVISRLRDEEGGPHPLCPVAALQHFLRLSQSSSSQKLFVHPSSLQGLTINKLRWYLCKIVKLSNPSSIPKCHDIRKMAASFAFFGQMSLEDILSLSGWRSINVFRKHYLVDIQAISNQFVVYGKPHHSR